MKTKAWRRALWKISLLLLTPLPLAALQKHAAKGMVLKVDPAHKTIVISCEDIPGYMAAMVMPFNVHDAKILQGLQPGTNIDFDLDVDANASFADNIRIRPLKAWNSTLHKRDD